MMYVYLALLNDYRKELLEPYNHVKKTADLLKVEGNEQLPEGQLLLQVGERVRK